MRKVILIITALVLTSHSISQWTQTSGPGGSTVITAMASVTISVFTATQNGIYRSTNDGDNWTPVNNGLTNTFITSIISNNGYLYAGGVGKVYRSTNGGGLWESFTANQFTSYALTSLAVSLPNIFAASSSQGVYKSSDGGNNWSLVFSAYVSDIVIKDNLIFAATQSSGIYYSPLSGGSWNQVNNGLASLYIFCLGASGSYIYAGAQNYLYRSSNNGQNWNALGSLPPNLNIKSVTPLPGMPGAIFARDGDRVFYSSNYGDSWTNISQGIPVKPGINALTLNLSYAFIGISLQGPYVWRRSLSEIITSVSIINGEVPQAFSLGQNYPNPFNPTTNFEFSIANSGFVNITIYDAMGREVETIVNQNLKAGTYKADWDAAKYPSCVYFYRLRAHEVSGSSTGDPSVDGQVFTETKKMILIK